MTSKYYCDHHFKKLVAATTETKNIVNVFHGNFSQSCAEPYCQDQPEWVINLIHRKLYLCTTIRQTDYGLIWSIAKHHSEEFAARQWYEIGNKLLEELAHSTHNVEGYRPDVIVTKRGPDPIREQEIINQLRVMGIDPDDEIEIRILELE